MKLAVVGSRSFEDQGEFIFKTLDKLHSKTPITLIVSGGARGVDTLAERWAELKDIPTKIFYANWNLYGKSAGMRRNEDIVNCADKVIAFWDGESRGTKNSIDRATKCGKLLEIVRIEL